MIHPVTLKIYNIMDGMPIIHVCEYIFSLSLCMCKLDSWADYRLRRGFQKIWGITALCQNFKIRKITIISL